METIKGLFAKELIDILHKALENYGNRPVKIEINDKQYVVNDLKFSASGKEYILFLNNDLTN